MVRVGDAPEDVEKRRTRVSLNLLPFLGARVKEWHHGIFRELSLGHAFKHRVRGHVIGHPFTEFLDVGDGVQNSALGEHVRVLGE